MDWFASVPLEVIKYILTSLNAVDIVNLSRVCKRFFAICEDNTLWKRIYDKKGENAFFRSFSLHGSNWKVISSIPLSSDSVSLTIDKSHFIVGESDGGPSSLKFLNPVNYEELHVETNVKPSHFCNPPLFDNMLYFPKANGKIWCFDTESCEAVHKITSVTPYDELLCANTNFLFSRSEDFDIQCWDRKSMTKVGVFSGHKSSLRSLSCNETYCFSGSYDTTLRVWDLRTLKCISILNFFSSSVRSQVLVHPYIIAADSSSVNVINTEDFSLTTKFVPQFLSKNHSTIKERPSLTFAGMHLIISTENAFGVYEGQEFKELQDHVQFEDISSIVGFGDTLYTSRGRKISLWKDNI